MKKQAQKLAVDRLPSGGGSYLDKFEASKSESKYYHATWIKNLHDWAQAVEDGTVAHNIPADVSTEDQKTIQSLGLKIDNVSRYSNIVWMKPKKYLELTTPPPGGFVNPMGYKGQKEKSLNDSLPFSTFRWICFT